MLRTKDIQILTAENVRVVPFSRHHLTQRYVSWLNDPEVVQFSEQRHHEHTLSTCTRYFEGIQKTDRYFFAIETSMYDIGHIGNIGVSIDAYNHLADMSIIVGEKRVWGKGLATAAWNVVLTEMLKRQGIRKVTAGTMAVNEAMLRLMQRSGMQIEAVRRHHFLWQGQEVDLVQAAIFGGNNTR